MLTKIEIVKTYWVGVEAGQKDELTSGIVTIIESGQADEMLDSEQMEALNAFRLALLNA